MCQERQKHMNKLHIMYIYIAMWICSLNMFAGGEQLKSHPNVYPKGYSFWIQLPEDYAETKEHTPLIIFLHGASLCGGSLNRAIKYGPINATKYGLTIHSIVIAPHNPGGPWSPMKINDILEWMKQNYAFAHDRVYVIGMSLGGYGTLDFSAVYPEKVAAAMALCGGTTIKDYEPLGRLPLWIIHGTADKAVNIKESKVIVETMRKQHNDARLRYDWLKGGSHELPSRYFYISQTYDWLFSHSLKDPGRPVERSIKITKDDLKHAYRNIKNDSFEE